MDSRIQGAQASHSGIRSLLQKTLGTIENLNDTLEIFIAEEQRATLRVEYLRRQLKQAESNCESLLTQIETTRGSKLAMEIVAQNLRHLTSPINNIPTEILVHIFKMTIDAANVDRRRLLVASPDDYSPLWTSLHLAQVCKQWSSICAATSSLWRILEFHAMENDPGRKREMESYRFDRYAASNSPNQQDLFIPRCTYDQLKHLCDKLRAQSIPYKAIEIEALEDPPGRWYLPALSAYGAILYRTSNVETTQFFTSLFQMVSKLTIYGGPPSWDALPFVLLETLIIRMFCAPDHPAEAITFTNGNLLQLLNAAPSLKRLELDCPVDDDEVAFRSDVRASHACITALSVHFHHLEGRKGLFGVQLDLPALETLEFLSMEYTSADVLCGDFIYKHLSPKRVILPDVHFQELTLATELLCRIPTAHTLEVTGNNANDLLKFAISRHHNTSPTPTLLSLPKVMKLVITGTNIEGSTLLELVRIKLQEKVTGVEGVDALEVIEMYDTPGVTASDWWIIQGILKEGRTANLI